MYVNGEYVHALCPWCKRMGVNPESGCSDVVPARSENGAAAVVVRLRHGGVVVTREDDGATLLASPASEGDWDRLWAVLESFGGGRGPAAWN